MGGRRVFIKHTCPRRSHINITKVDDYLTIHLSNTCYDPLLGEYNLKIPHQHHHSGKNTTHSNETSIGYFKNLQLIFFLVTLFVNLWRNFTTFQSTQYPVNFTLLASWKKSHAAFRTSSTLNFRWAFSSLEEEWPPVDLYWFFEISIWAFISNWNKNQFQN